MSEQLALRLLRSKGYEIEATNARYPVGEIDIVARDGRTLCFVEVRSASSFEWGGAAASVTTRKQRRLIRAAAWYLARQRAVPAETRFDVVTVQWRASAPPLVELIPNAFYADG